MQHTQTVTHQLSCSISHNLYKCHFPTSFLFSSNSFNFSSSSLLSFSLAARSNSRCRARAFSFSARSLQKQTSIKENTTNSTCLPSSFNLLHISVQKWGLRLSCRDATVEMLADLSAAAWRSRSNSCSLFCSRALRASASLRARCSSSSAFFLASNSCCCFSSS